MRKVSICKNWSKSITEDWLIKKGYKISFMNQLEGKRAQEYNESSPEKFMFHIVHTKHKSTTILHLLKRSLKCIVL